MWKKFLFHPKNCKSCLLKWNKDEKYHCWSIWCYRCGTVAWTQDRFLPFIKYWYKLSSQKPHQPHIPHPKNHPKAFKHYITLKLFSASLRWWTLYGLDFRVSDHKICLPNHLRWARKPVPSASVQAKCGQPLTITILPYYKMWCVTNLRLCAIELQLEASGAVYGWPPATLVKQQHWQIVKHGTDRKKRAIEISRWV